MITTKAGILEFLRRISVKDSENKDGGGRYQWWWRPDSKKLFSENMSGINWHWYHEEKGGKWSFIFLNYYKALNHIQ